MSAWSSVPTFSFPKRTATTLPLLPWDRMGRGLAFQDGYISSWDWMMPPKPPIARVIRITRKIEGAF
jgi:hypothetical protein